MAPDEGEEGRGVLLGQLHVDVPPLTGCAVAERLCVVRGRVDAGPHARLRIRRSDLGVVHRSGVIDRLCLDRAVCRVRVEEAGLELLRRREGSGVCLHLQVPAVLEEVGGVDDEGRNREGHWKKGDDEDDHRAALVCVHPAHRTAHHPHPAETASASRSRRMVAFPVIVVLGASGTAFEMSGIQL